MRSSSPSFGKKAVVKVLLYYLSYGVNEEDSCARISRFQTIETSVLAKLGSVPSGSTADDYIIDGINLTLESIQQFAEGFKAVDPDVARGPGLRSRKSTAINYNYIEQCLAFLRREDVDRGLLAQFNKGLKYFHANSENPTFSSPFRATNGASCYPERKIKALIKEEKKEAKTVAKAAAKEAAQREKAARAAAVALKALAEAASDGLARKRVNGGCFSSFCRLITGCLNGLAAATAAPSKVPVPSRGCNKPPFFARRAELSAQKIDGVADVYSAATHADTDGEGVEFTHDNPMFRGL
jgi:hypothetical protein